MATLSDIKSIYFNRRLMVTLLLGFASGLPLALSSSTLQAWYAVEDVSIVSIGLLGLVAQPYVYKFLWAPLLDKFTPPWLGRRRGWILSLQVGLVFSILFMSVLNPRDNPMLLAIAALLVAFFSATQDMAIDAYRTDLLPPEERGYGAAYYTSGYRIAYIISGGLALILAQVVGWKLTLWLVAGLMGVCMFGSVLGPVPDSDATERKPLSWHESVIEPFHHYFTQPKAAYLLLFILFYKFSDAFGLSLTTTFLYRGVGFSLVDIGGIYKIVGLSATLLGVFVGGYYVKKWGLFKSLFVFGVCQAVSNLSFVVLALAGKNYTILILSVFLENATAGMGTAAFLALLMSLCDVRYTATQFALLSAVASVGRVYSQPIAGYFVASYGWVLFYSFTVLLALPGLALLWCLRERITQVGEPQHA